MKRKYLLLALVALILGLAGCRIITQRTSFAPSDLTGQIVSSSEISLTWKDNSADEKGFYIYRKTTDNYSRVGVVLANVDSYNDKGLDPETTYTDKVTAYNDSGESESSNEITITTTEEMPPSAPSDLAGIAVAYNKIDLNWQDNSDDEEGFYVYTKTTGDYYEVADLPANTVHFAHSGLEPLEKYIYYVQAYNEFGAADSNIAEATTLSGVEILSCYWKRRSGCIDVSGQARNTTNETLVWVSFIYCFYDADAILIDSIVNGVGNIPPLASFYFGIVYRYSDLPRIAYVTAAVSDVDID